MNKLKNLLYKHANILAVILLIILMFETGSFILSKSVTIDEFGHLPSGYGYLSTGNPAFADLNPPLINLISALPVTLTGAALGWQQGLPVPNFWQHGYLFMGANFDNYHNIFITGRFAILLLSILLGIFVYIWSSKLYGRISGLASLTLYVFSPNIIAHSGLVTTDLGVSAFSLMAVYFYWKFNREQFLKYLLLSGIFLGAALLSKFSALVMIPIFIILAALEGINENGRFEKEPLVFLIPIFLIAVLEINLAYYFKGCFLPLSDFAFKSGLLSNLAAKAEWLPSLVPANYLSALDSQLADTGRGAVSYLLGNFSKGNWLSYFPIAFLVKVPLGITALIIIALVLTVREKNIMGFLKHEAFLVVTAVFIFVFVTVTNKKQFGFRFLLPVLPFLFIWVGKVFESGPAEGKRKFRLSYLAAPLLLWSVFSSALVYPNYLAYFNEIAGGHNNGYKWLIDSNIDWGQDLPALKDHMDEKGIEKIKLGYFGRVDPRLYGINYEDLGSKPTSGNIAISVTFLMGRPYMVYTEERQVKFVPLNYFSWLRNHKPAGKAGYSIFIYKIPEN